MTPKHKIQREILRAAQENEPEVFDFGELNTAEQIDEAYNILVEANAHWDYESEFREGDIETNIPNEYSRHYETKSVAMKTTEGDWIGWTYYYGGGKYGEPGSIDWMSESYDLECFEEEKLVVVRTFKKVALPPDQQEKL